MNYNVEVKLLAITPDSENLLERSGRICYASEDKLGTNQKWLQARIRQGHESLIEHASATFFIKASRTLTHELVRHRIASYSQRSQRYVHETRAEYVSPPELAKEIDPKNAKVFHDAMAASWQAYHTLLEAGVKPEIARYVLPNACTTEIICTWNFRQIRHIIKTRTDQAALPEFRVIAEKIKDIMKEQAPKVFDDL